MCGEQFDAECQSNKMCTVAVIGHSLVPTTVTLNDLDDVTIDMHCFPGATIDSLTHHLNQHNFWNKTYDLIILCIRGNVLVRDNVSNVFDKFCNLIRRLLQRTTKLSACTMEYQLHQTGHRSGADRETYQLKVTKINLKIRRFLTKIGHRYLDLGKTDFTYNRTSDRVHFNSFSKAKFCSYVDREVKAIVNRA